MRQDGDDIIFAAPGGDVIVVKTDTHRKTMFHNLQSNVRVYVSMLPVNSAGSGPLNPGQDVAPQ